MSVDTIAFRHEPFPVSGTHQSAIPLTLPSAGSAGHPACRSRNLVFAAPFIRLSDQSMKRQKASHTITAAFHFVFTAFVIVMYFFDFEAVFRSKAKVIFAPNLSVAFNWNAWAFFFTAFRVRVLDAGVTFVILFVVF